MESPCVSGPHWSTVSMAPRPEHFVPGPGPALSVASCRLGVQQIRVLGPRGAVFSRGPGGSAPDWRHTNSMRPSTCEQKFSVPGRFRWATGLHIFSIQNCTFPCAGFGRTEATRGNSATPPPPPSPPRSQRPISRPFRRLFGSCFSGNEAPT